VAKGPVESRSLNELWLAALQSLIANVAHDLKGALNGVSVNLEVVRSRAEREGTPISDVQKYAGAAIDQLGVVIRMNTALLSLGRVGRGPADVSLVARQIVILLEDTLRSDGATVEIEVEGGLSTFTAAPAVAVRLALTESIIAAAAQKRDVRVRVRAVPQTRVDIRAAGAVTLTEQVTAMLQGAGIALQTDGHGISIVFPGPPESPTEEA
jgi:signal transduction histidine kinase